MGDNPFLPNSGLYALGAIDRGDRRGHWMAAARLVVELQSYQHHAHRQAFDRDYAKLGRLTLSGYRVLPLTARQLLDEADRVLGALRSLIEAPSRQGTPLRSAVPAPTL